MTPQTFFNQFFNFTRLRFTFRNEKGNGTIVIYQHATFPKAFDNRIRCGSFQRYSLCPTKAP